MSLPVRLDAIPQESFPRVSGDEPVLRPTAVQVFSFPRVSGDEPFVLAIAVAPFTFSPRERG